MREAVRRLAARECDDVLFTFSIQLDHLLEIAHDLGMERAVRKALAEQAAVASIGPVMTAALTAHGCPPDVIPRHPKMWALVKAASDEAAAALAAKAAHSPGRGGGYERRISPVSAKTADIQNERCS